MARRHGAPTHGHRWAGDSRSSVVHDLDHEGQRCAVDETIRAHRLVIFEPDSLEQARMEGFERCSYCTGYGPPP
jgi:hypothetical protein